MIKELTGVLELIKNSMKSFFGNRIKDDLVKIFEETGMKNYLITIENGKFILYMEKDDYEDLLNHKEDIHKYIDYIYRVENRRMIKNILDTAWGLKTVFMYVLTYRREEYKKSKINNI